MGFIVCCWFGVGFFLLLLLFLFVIFVWFFLAFPRSITADGSQQIFFICKDTKGLCRMKHRAINQIYVEGLLYLRKTIGEISRDFQILLCFSSL